MKINRSSWHYRLVRCVFNTADVPSSICAYFWKVVLSGMAAVAVSIVALLGSILFVAGMGLYWYEVFGGATGDLSVLVLSGVFNAVVLCNFALAVMNNTKIGQKVLHWELCMRSRSYKPKSDSVVIGYLRAKKERFCPTIEFVDG